MATHIHIDQVVVAAHLPRFHCAATTLIPRQHLLLRECRTDVSVAEAITLRPRAAHATIEQRDCADLSEVTVSVQPSSCASKMNRSDPIST
eukprot:6179717-Pleurochrysis_carterae.AAC.5